MACIELIAYYREDLSTLRCISRDLPYTSSSFVVCFQKFVEFDLPCSLSTESLVDTGRVKLCFGEYTTCPIVSPVEVKSISAAKCVPRGVPFILTGFNVFCGTVLADADSWCYTRSHIVEVVHGDCVNSLEGSSISFNEKGVSSFVGGVLKISQYVRPTTFIKKHEFPSSLIMVEPVAVIKERDTVFYLCHNNHKVESIEAGPGSKCSKCDASEKDLRKCSLGVFKIVDMDGGSVCVECWRRPRTRQIYVFGSTPFGMSIIRT